MLFGDPPLPFLISIPPLPSCDEIVIVERCKTCLQRRDKRDLEGTPSFSPLLFPFFRRFSPPLLGTRAFARGGGVGEKLEGVEGVIVPPLFFAVLPPFTR